LNNSSHSQKILIYLKFIGYDYSLVAIANVCSTVLKQSTSGENVTAHTENEHDLQSHRPRSPHHQRQNRR
jgi:hypothetical protein